ncbi:MAG TPA: sterol desaturase family protein [Flavobacteriales bacterium]|nr:sterol desaturase family protein [Flavobacteriales bacterium]HNU55465.1 sterol desaturase family protein [Flavobacteriales bacterium]
MGTWTILAIITLTFVLMEGVAWATHKYVMHGFLWHLHADHHKKDHYGFLERNDTFFLIFAVPSMALFAIGSWLGFHTPWFWIGLGILVYGIAYFLVHEVFIHQRIKWLRNTHNAYFLGIRKAHKVHHKHLGKEDGECFGMLWVPLKYFREARKALANQRH